MSWTLLRLWKISSGNPLNAKLDGFNYTYTALLEDKPVKSVRKPKPAVPKRRRR